jgi:hypothetical protein
VFLVGPMPIEIAAIGAHGISLLGQSHRWPSFAMSGLLE